MKWGKVAIGDLVNLRQGFAINKKTDHHISDVPTNLHLLRIGDMKDGKFSIFVKDTIPEKFVAKDKDIIYTRTGQVGLVFRKQYGVIHNNCFTVNTIDEKILNQDYLYYALQEKSFLEEAISRATGAAQPDLPHSAFNSIKIFLPPIENQIKITKILDVYNCLIENNQRQIKLLEEAAQRLYKEWFVDLHFPGHEDVEIVDGLPKGWEWKKCNDVASLIKRGISPVYNDEGKYIVINQKCIRTAIVNMKEARRQEKDYKKEFNLMDGDIVICSTGMGTLGRVGKIYGVYENTTFDSHVTLVRSKDDFGKQYLYHWMKHRENYLMSMGQGSTQQQELYRGVIEMLDVLVPNEKLLSSFEHNAQEIHNQIIVLNKQLDLMVDARDRLLPKLMSGEVEV